MLPPQPPAAPVTAQVTQLPSPDDPHYLQALEKALFSAVVHNNAALVSMIIAQRPDLLSACNHAGESALDLAYSRGSREAATVLEQFTIQVSRFLIYQSPACFTNPLNHY